MISNRPYPGHDLQRPSIQNKEGFLAKKLTEYAGMGAMEGDDLFYRSISMDSEAERNGEYGFFLEISEQMLEWADEGSDLREEIHRLTIRPEIQNAMLKAYEMFKEELFSERKSSEPVENALSLEDEKWKVYRDVIPLPPRESFFSCWKRN